jgi:hypothetical protein
VKEMTANRDMSNRALFAWFLIFAGCAFVIQSVTFGGQLFAVYWIPVNIKILVIGLEMQFIGSILLLVSNRKKNTET